MKKNQVIYAVVAIIIIVTITLGILLIGMNDSIGGLADFDNDGLPNIIDPDDDNDGVNDIDDYDPYDPNITEEPEDDDEEETPTNSTEWVTIQLFIQDYDTSQPNTPGNPSYYILSVGGDTYTYVEWVDLELGDASPPYTWECIVHKQVDGSVFDPYSEWGEISYDGSTDTWVDDTSPNYLSPFGSGVWNLGASSLVFNDGIYVAGLSGHYICFDFYVWTSYAYWDYYVTFQVP